MLQHNWKPEHITIGGEYLHESTTPPLNNIFTSEGFPPFISQNGLDIVSKTGEVHGTGDGEVTFLSPDNSQFVWKQYKKHKGEYTGYKATAHVVKLTNTTVNKENSTETSNLYFSPSQTGQPYTGFKNGQLVMTPDKTVYFKKLFPNRNKNGEQEQGITTVALEQVRNNVPPQTCYLHELDISFTGDYIPLIPLNKF